tara:strand:- start:123138 stop:124088 length:951 start_codon:yes stop_codon:yes gene_type:complete
MYIKFIKLCLILSVILSFYIENALAQQISFNRSIHNGVMKYDYVWRNPNGQKFNTSFKLYADDVKRSLTEFQKFDQSELDKAVTLQIQEFIKYHTPSGMSVDFNEKTRQISFEGNLKQNKINRFMKLMEEEQEKVNQAYFKKRFYNYNAKENTIRPAHGTIAKRYVLAMRPVAYALKENVRGGTSRDITNHVLHFIQSIPYDTLEDVRNSNGAGFLTPYGIIQGNKGDCDSKSVMFAAIMRNIYPYARIAVIYVPGHALVGFDYKKGRDDFAINIDVNTFVLAEPVGPNQSDLGVVSPSALAVLRQGGYSYEEVPY